MTAMMHDLLHILYGGYQGSMYNSLQDKALNFILPFHCCSANHTIAIVQGPETYETLAASFKEVFREINQVQADGSVHINGENIPVELYLGGDYKVSTFKSTQMIAYLVK